jgi:CRISPR-associated endonuclease/helicase Cas3
VRGIGGRMIKAEQFYRNNFNIDSAYEHQIKMWDNLQAMKFPLLLKAPTGSGKTEAVLAPFLSQFVDNHFHIAPRMIYVLPMRVLVNSVAGRIRKYSQKISPHISVEVQHGDSPNSPFFITDIVVTTLDQFLYGFARASGQVGRHLDIPAGSIASSVVVFDEAHMYRDRFTFSIMRALMEILHKSHIPFVVMTATMPGILEKSLFENIPLLDNQKLVSNININSNLKISIENNSLYLNGDVNISEKLLNRISKHKTLIIVNQVKRAQKIYEKIKSSLDLSDKEIVLLHSRFTKTDRKSHEEKAVSLIPHKEEGTVIIPKGVGIVVSTQVLDAGIDFSTQLLLTELAPADSLIQRAGRCARYEGESGEMIVFPVEEENRGYLPYGREHLSKALEWLQKHEQFNIKDFDEVCSFVDETLDYQANDYEAKDTLIDLYECVLYADERPANIQLRDGKPITLVVVDLSVGVGRKKEDKIKDAIRKTNIRDNSINVDFGVGWKLLKDGTLRLRLNFDGEKGEWDFTEVKDISPFRYYLLEKDNYDQLKGVIPDASSFII